MPRADPRQHASPLTDQIERADDISSLPRYIREQILDELGDELSAEGLRLDTEPNAYGLGIEALTDALRLAWDPD